MEIRFNVGELIQPDLIPDPALLFLGLIAP
jgi:hypothetical protein